MASEQDGEIAQKGGTEVKFGKHGGFGGKRKKKHRKHKSRSMGKR